MMLNLKSFVLGLLIILMGLVACTQEMVIPATELSSYPPLATETTTATPLPSATPSSTNTPIVSTRTATPTKTPKQVNIIQSTPTPKPSATPALFNLPDWIIEPSANILLLGNKETKEVSIFNVDTGEQYDIHVNVDDLAPNWRWQGDHYWLSPEFQERGQVIDVIDIVTGDIVILSDVNRDALSPDGRYAAHTTIRGEDAGLVTIIDYETGAETELVNPFLHYQRLDETFAERAYASYWSPNGAFLSVLYDKHYYSDNYDRNLVIYTPSGDIFRQYANVDTSWHNPWASVPPYNILYTNNNRSTTPCILKITENEKTCLGAVGEWAANQNVVLFNYRWSPDGNQISYVYGGSDPPNTGLCYYELTTQNIICPVSTHDLQFDEQLFARIQFWSPDGKYMVLFFDEVGITDVIGPQRVAVVDIDSQNFQILEGEYLFPFSNPWRPPIPQETNE